MHLYKNMHYISCKKFFVQFIKKHWKYRIYLKSMGFKGQAKKYRNLQEIQD